MRTILYLLVITGVFFCSDAFSQSEKIIPAAQLREDFTIFKKALLDLHPGIYRYNTPDYLLQNCREK